jgi:hypothetical protein
MSPEELIEMNPPKYSHSTFSPSRRNRIVEPTANRTNTATNTARIAPYILHTRVSSDSTHEPLLRIVGSSRTPKSTTKSVRISTIYYDSSGTAVCSFNIEIPFGWTPKLFLGLLLQEWCLSNVISLFRVEDKACDDIFKMRLLYYNRNATQVNPKFTKL